MVSADRSATLLRTTHSRRVAGILTALVAGMGWMPLLVILTDFASASVVELVLVVAVVATGAQLLYSLRLGLVVGDTTLRIRRALLPAVVFDRREVVVVPVRGRAQDETTPDDRSDWLLALRMGAREQRIPGTYLNTGSQCPGGPCRLVTRVDRPWYRWPARPIVREDVVWTAGQPEAMLAAVTAYLRAEPDPKLGRLSEL
jgi:hypothetical protein